MLGLKMHHVASITSSIDESLESYKGVFESGKISEKIFVSSQGVHVCFIEIDNDKYLELVEPAGDDSIIARLAKKNVTYYHMGYWAPDFDKCLEVLEEKNYKHLSTFHSEAFGGRRCAFLYSPEMHLIELLEEE